MKDKKYQVFLDGEWIGTTQLEKADPTMGVVLGEFHGANFELTSRFIRDYCIQNGIDFREMPELNFISTDSIPNLEVRDDRGQTIPAQGQMIEGTDQDSYDILLVGIPNPYYTSEFPNHIKIYEDRFR